MPKGKLRESIAAEAARLLLRGTETEYPSARKRAARWLSRRKVDPDDLPSYAEIRSQLYMLSGLFAQEQHAAALERMRQSALELMELLGDFGPRLFGCAVEGPATPGAEITITLTAEAAETVLAVLAEAGFRAKRLRPADSKDLPSPDGQCRIRLHHGFPCELTVQSPESSAKSAERLPGDSGLSTLDTHELRRLIGTTRPPDGQTTRRPDEYHPDVLATFRMLLSRLEQVPMDPREHPEGDALYHSLQVYELGLFECAYDEEFLLACLLHDAGLGIDRRKPLPALLEALEGLITDRTRFLLEHLPAAHDYLNSGKISRSLRRSEHFEELMLLARCDVNGRVPGAPVSSLDEALETIAGLSTAWDDV